MSESRSKIQPDRSSSATDISNADHPVARSLEDPKGKRQQQVSILDSIEHIKERKKTLLRNISNDKTEKQLLTDINHWEKESVAYIKLKAKQTKKELQQRLKELNDEINGSFDEFSTDLDWKLKSKTYTETDIQQWTELLKKNERMLKNISATRVTMSPLSSFELIQMDIHTVDSSPENVAHSKEKPRKTSQHIRSTEDSRSEICNQVLSHETTQSSKYQYPSVICPGTNFNRSKIHELFEHLQCLVAMDKHGPMSGNCDVQTTQMEKFLTKKFGFRNIPGKYIVQGVKAFEWNQSLQTSDPQSVISFPRRAKAPFRMTVQEILDWQKSYAVYADHTVPGMTKEFLRTALQGLSKPGDEAFRMKFVVRVSQCPILMEFNARIIPREVKHDWPHRIKLVSVTGIDFAGRIHDVNDITTYVDNWPDIYELNPKSGSPAVYNGRDFRIKAKDPRSRLNENTLLKDLMSMARLRLRACDKENVQIVVETGIGLGVFAGRAIGVDEKVRALSAKAIRTVLEQDGSSYENILGVVFALPIFDGDFRNGRRQDVYQAFADEFNTNKYIGCIPVMIADQDMHRLTVAIAFAGYRVSELNPADSHGVFGEYWQNRGPAVEEKLALTTVGLLVQHHLFNPHILDPDHYHLI